MDINFVSRDDSHFEPELYIKILIAICKADKNNGHPEYAYVRTQAKALSIDFDKFWKTVDKTFSIKQIKVSRLTALIIIKDCLQLATLDRNLSLGEKERIYTYAKTFNIPRFDVDYLEKWLCECRILQEKWDKLLSHTHIQL